MAPRGLAAGSLCLCLAGCSGAGRAPELNLYAAQGQEVTTPLLDEYQRLHPGLRINVIRGGAGELLSRLRAERQSPLGDVFWGGSLELYRANADLFGPVEIAEAAAFESRDPEKKWHPWTRNVLHLVVNTSRVPGRPPRSLKELADPRWRERGGIGLSNPAVSGTAYTIVPALVTALGWDYVEALLKNAKITDASETVFKWLRDGEVAVSFLFESMLSVYVEAGAPLQVVLPEEGLIIQDDGCGLLAGARNPEAGAAFLNWMATEDAHRIVQRALRRRSARRGLPPPPGLASLEGQRLIRPDLEWVTTQREQILQRFAEARARAGR